MGKGGRVACILTPWLLTIASFVCITLIEVSGWNKSVLPGYYFLKVNFTDLDLSGASGLANSTSLTAALKEVEGDLADIYEIHLWNYCNSSTSNDTISRCSGRTAGFTFDFLDVWGLNNTQAASDSSSGYSNNQLQTAENDLTSKTEQLEDNLLGSTARKALDAYRKIGKAMFYLYAVSFWATLATIVAGILAICSRWGSLITWILAFVSLLICCWREVTSTDVQSQGSSVVNTAAVALSTGLYIALDEGLKGVLNNYNVHVNIGTSAMVVTWLSVVFGWGATLFWLFSICCCSGSSNPHHRCVSSDNCLFDSIY